MSLPKRDNGMGCRAGYACSPMALDAPLDAGAMAVPRYDKSS